MEVTGDPWHNGDQTAFTGRGLGYYFRLLFLLFFHGVEQQRAHKVQVHDGNCTVEVHET